MLFCLGWGGGGGVRPPGRLPPPRCAAPSPPIPGAGPARGAADRRAAVGGEGLSLFRGGRPGGAAPHQTSQKGVISRGFFYSAMYIGIMLVVDLLYGIIDPRIRLAKGDD